MDNLRRGQAIEGENLAPGVVDSRREDSGAVKCDGKVASGIAAAGDRWAREGELEPELVTIPFQARRQLPDEGYRASEIADRLDIGGDPSCDLRGTLEPFDR